MVSRSVKVSLTLLFLFFVLLLILGFIILGSGKTHKTNENEEDVVVPGYSLDSSRWLDNNLTYRIR